MSVRERARLFKTNLGGTAGIIAPVLFLGQELFAFLRRRTVVFNQKTERKINMEKKIPYKTYLDESEMPKQWYNLRADMKNKPAPILNPGTLKPMTVDELEQVFCRELAEQELDDTTPYIDIPEEIQEFYKMYRPSPPCKSLLS